MLIAMWFFRSPEIVFGEDSLSYLSTLDLKRVVIVTDRYLKESKVISMVKNSLPASAQMVVVGDVPAEPSFDDMLPSLENVRNFSPDWFIAVGGGSSIDTAKILFALYERPDLSVYDITPIVKLNLRKKSRLIAIPTTSGTGSECSWAAVVSERGEKRKNELASKEILPDIAILDPKMVIDLPEEQTRNTATDAIVHAIESYVSSWRNPYSDALAEKAIELITGNLPSVLIKADNIKAREQVHIGASMAGLSFSNSQIGLAHALGHAFGALFKIPHGKSVGIFLPSVVRFNYPYCSDRYDRLNAIFPEDIREKKLDLTLENFLNKIGQPLKIHQMGIDEKNYSNQVETIVELASESTGITTNPRDANREDIRNIAMSVVNLSK
ncbi:MAG: iron-containing alcohol dehydrogenase [Conexivisphaerales archaeon]